MSPRDHEKTPLMHTLKKQMDTNGFQRWKEKSDDKKLLWILKRCSIEQDVKKRRTLIHVLTLAHSNATGAMKTASDSEQEALP